MLRDPGSVIGRTGERAAIAGLLADARSGRSGALVLVGEPGVGKSMLLVDAVRQADGLRVLRAAGVETEVDLPFAGLHQLLRPVLNLVDRLPSRQAQALLGALGLVEHRSEDRFLVAVAALSLLSEAAEDGPVLCVVEDAHWLDHSSVEALGFATRRLDAEGVVLLAATREAPWPGVPALPIEGFDRQDALRLLREHAGDVTEPVAHLLVDETGGNPLALVELAMSLSAAQLEGREVLPQPLRLTGRIQEAFLGRVRGLPAPTQTLLLVAAADDTGDAAVTFRAAAELGVGADAFEPAERAGLAMVDEDRIVFRHPLIRAAVYQAATFVARTSAHRALVQALDGDMHVARRTWHLAAASTGPDEGIARELERSADVARRRGGFAVASAALERAAQLSPERSGRARLLVAAAETAYQAGQADRAAGLADRAGTMIDDPATADEVACLRGRIELVRGSSLTAHTLLATAAGRMAERDPRAAAAELIHAARAAWNLNDAERLTRTTDLLATLPLPDEDPLAALASSAIGVGELMAGRTAAAVARIHAATAAWLPLVSTNATDGLESWVVESWLIMAGATRLIGDHGSGLTLAEAAVTQCRERGLAARLPFALGNLALYEALVGRHSAALANATEALELARDLGQQVSICNCASVLAWLAAVRGDETRCHEYADEAVGLAETYQLTSIAVFATWAVGLLELSLGRPERALDRLTDELAGPVVNPLTRILVVPDLVEAATRAGRPGESGQWVVPFEAWAAATGQPWAAATAHRCRALLADDGAEEQFEAALRCHDEAGPHDRPFDRARTQLAYGQWLRRTRRRAEARMHLSAAHETFERLGATPWADRASSELRATGQTVRRRDDQAATRLTPQELQVVRRVAEGGSNSDVAAQLFISPRTVAYHLYKAFPKLGISTRAELAHLDLEALVATH